MDLNFDLSSIILMITIVQGIFLGGVLVFGRSWQHPSTLLGLILFFFSIGLIYDVIRHINLLTEHPELYFLPVKLYYIPGPLAYLFAKKLTPNALETKDYLWLLPAVIEFSVLMILFALPIEMKSAIENHSSASALFFLMYRHLWIPFTIFFFYKSYRLIKENRTRFMNFFSGSQDRLMRWAMRSSIFGGIFCCTFLTKFFVAPQTYDSYFFPINAALIMILVFTIGTWGIKQSFVDLDYSEFITFDAPSEISEGQSQEIKEKAENEETTGMLILETLRMYIETHKPYRDPELTVDSLAQSCKIPARQISSSINRFADINFNTFINQFRVAEAQRMLLDPKFSHLNILGIGLEVGFNSKATFYSVFKKQTGMTPAKWQKQTS